MRDAYLRKTSIRDAAPKHRRLMSAAAAIALGLSLTAGAAGAQDLGLEQLRQSALTTLAQLNMDTSTIEFLTLDELSQIQSIGSSGDATADQRARAETVLRNADARIAAGDIEVPTGPTGDLSQDDFSALATLEASATQYFARIGLSGIDVKSLTLDQLLQIQSVQSGGDSSGEQRSRIERIIAN